MHNVELLTADQRIPPVRGLVLAHNHKGAPLDLTDLKRWFRVNRDVFKTEKIDLFLNRFDRDLLPPLLEHARVLGVKLSLRTDCSEPPDVLARPEAADLFDVFLTPASVDAIHLPAWIGACQTAGLRIRFQVQPPFGPDFDPNRLADRLCVDGVVAVNVMLGDPFAPPAPCRNADSSRATVAAMNALATALAARGVESDLWGLPLCHVTPENLGRAGNSQQFFLDHQQYHRMAYDFAVKVFACGPNAAGKAITIPLGRNASTNWFIDSKMLTWILDSPWRHLRLLVWRKLTRPLRIVRGSPKPLEESESAYQREIDRLRKKADQELGPLCAQCSLRRICDHESGLFRRNLPGLTVTPQPGDLVVSPLHFMTRQPKHYDQIDAERVKFTADYQALAKETIDIITNHPPTREVDSFDYEIEGQWTHQMPGGNRWYSFTNSEKISTVLTRTVPPLTIAMTLGGGIAEYAGFGFGRHSKYVCPMETYSHQVVLHINADGHYAMLRDGIPVRPIEFEGVQYVPARMAGLLEPRISLWNIDGSIVTQTVLLWEGHPAVAAELARIKYSVLIVSTRYSRRLESVLLCLAHQQGIDLEQIEVIVAYVPGLDATDDVIDSMRLAHPRLRIVRAPFTERDARAKGFMINESARVASGEWLLLLDSDILLAPNMFAKMEEVAGATNFICPDGRMMLTLEDTAKVLLGELQPWRDWEALLQSAGEFRYREAGGVPIGFFQCVRKKCMEKVPYIELDHFEGADWHFGYNIREEFGKETRLSGIPVLHMDHGGSQWYGTQKQR